MLQDEKSYRNKSRINQLKQLISKVKAASTESLHRMGKVRSEVELSVQENRNDSLIINDKKKKKLNIFLLLFIILFCGISGCLIRSNAKNKAALQEGIAEDIIRFHVIANSDSPKDQALKLELKDELVNYLSPLLSNSASIKESRSIITKQLPYLKSLAEDYIIQHDYDYSVTVALTECYFPMKVYGAFTFPPGNYEALRVQIGEAKGKNWWCVMFPPLCFVDETYSIVDEDTDKKLQTLLTEEEYDALISKKTPIKIKFKLWEALKSIFK